MKPQPRRQIVRLAAGFYMIALAHLAPPPPDDSIEYFAVAVFFSSGCKQAGL